MMVTSLTAVARGCWACCLATWTQSQLQMPWLLAMLLWQVIDQSRGPAAMQNHKVHCCEWRCMKPRKHDVARMSYRNQVLKCVLQGLDNRAVASLGRGGTAAAAALQHSGGEARH